jgi:LmbE family N-acetylglucosaminyl deacetylase
VGALESSHLNGTPRIEVAGMSESAWSGWLAGIARRELGDWLLAGSRLVVLAPHPDDEILACGGLLAMHTARGGESLIMAASDGEASHAGCTHSPATPWALADGFADLAQHRRSESSEGLKRLAPKSFKTVRFGLPDGGLAQRQGELQAHLEQWLKPGDTLLTTWRHDAHPDHESCGQAAARTAASVGCRLLEAPVWMWHWGQPNDARVPWHRLGSLALPHDVVQRKALALDAHVSQLTPRDGVTGPVLGDEMVRRAQRSCEYFFA